jgi:polysaccharide deacetylase family protein (PEP-CTERM system associated)
MNLEQKYLFSVDLEDVRDRLSNGARYPDRIPKLVNDFLTFLDQSSSKATFFIEGRIAKRHPKLIAEIANAGHEIACHTDTHPELTSLSKSQFKDEMERNKDALSSACGEKIIGFRAPYFSMVPSSSWTYEILANLGFEYSSSVLPAKNPLFGWPEFGVKPKIISGVLELPMTLTALPKFNVPFAGGTYFRILPSFVLTTLFKRHFKKNKCPVLGYFHPYDIDTEQVDFIFPGMEQKPIWNQLMYLGRGNVCNKLHKIMKHGFVIKRYDHYAKTLREEL